MNLTISSCLAVISEWKGFERNLTNIWQDIDHNSPYRDWISLFPDITNFHGSFIYNLEG